VVDTGVGVPRDRLGKLLLVDQKTTSTGTAGEIGTGLGLPLCAELILKLGGKLTLESEPGEGLTATLILPSGG
jgi:signal transduction histidine kinase